MLLRRKRGRDIADAQKKSGDGLSHFVVQFARNGSAFGLLDLYQPRREILELMHMLLSNPSEAQKPASGERRK